MKKLFLSLILIILCSCAPTKKLSITHRLPASAENSAVITYNLNDTPPNDAQLLGSIKIGDSGFSTKCSYDKVIAFAHKEARSIGGNAIKITAHRLPSVLGSTCHRIEADILKVNIGQISHHDTTTEIDQQLAEAGCAIIHFYRFAGTEFIIGYDVKIGDTVLARMTNNSKESIKVKAIGNTTVTATTESKAELPITLEPGKHYYVRCSVTIGVMVGHPKLELIESGVGKVEFASIKAKE